MRKEHSRMSAPMRARANQTPTPVGPSGVRRNVIAVPGSLRQMFARTRAEVGSSARTRVSDARSEKSLDLDRRERFPWASKVLVAACAAAFSINASADPEYWYITDPEWASAFPGKYSFAQLPELCAAFGQQVAARYPSPAGWTGYLTGTDSGWRICAARENGTAGWLAVRLIDGGCAGSSWVPKPGAPDRFPEGQYCMWAPSPPPPPPPPLPLGCASGDGGFTQCPGDTGVPPASPAPAPAGTPVNGGPSSNVGTPDGADSPDPTDPGVQPDARMSLPAAAWASGRARPALASASSA